MALNSVLASHAVLYGSEVAIHARIQEFSSGGVQVSLTKKALTFFWFFFRPQLILPKSNGQF